MPSNHGTYFGIYTPIRVVHYALGHISAYNMDNTILLYKYVGSFWEKKIMRIDKKW
jgi:hypothetical protein